MRAHDLLQISGLADLVCVGWEVPEKRCPLWVEHSLQGAPERASNASTRAGSREIRNGVQTLAIFR